MKSITFVVICLCITWASAKHSRRGAWLSPWPRTTYPHKECNCDSAPRPLDLNERRAEEIKQLKFPQDPECGISYDPVDDNYPDGFDRRKFPWILSVTRGDQHLCDGVLIYPDVLMTSAHCVENDKDEELIIQATTIPDGLHGWELDYRRLVSEVHINPTYKACSRSNNLAILILSKPFALDDLIKVACLPVLNEPYYIGSCAKKLMQPTSDDESDDDHCGDRIFRAPSSSHSMGEESCVQGNNTTSFIKSTGSYSLLCGLSKTSSKFYYLGSVVSVRMCGPENEGYKFYDTLYKFMPWMHSILRDRFIDYKVNEKYLSFLL